MLCGDSTLPTANNLTGWAVRGMVRVVGMVEEMARAGMVFDPADVATFDELTARAKEALAGTPREKPVPRSSRQQSEKTTVRQPHRLTQEAVAKALALPEQEFREAVALLLARFGIVK